MSDPTPDLPALRALLDAATPGPWAAGRDDLQLHDGRTGEPFTNIYWDDPDEVFHLGSQQPGVVAKCVSSHGDKPDAALIVAAVNALPSLLALAERQGEEIARREADDAPVQERITELTGDVMALTNEIARLLSERDDAREEARLQEATADMYRTSHAEQRARAESAEARVATLEAALADARADLVAMHDNADLMLEGDTPGFIEAVLSIRERITARREEESEWQRLARDGDTVAAFKVLRKTEGVPLKQAARQVRAFQAEITKGADRE